MTNKLYLHINSVNLAHYFGCACIKPSRYFLSRSEDIQSNFPDYLLLSNANHLANSDCSIELILTVDETKNLLTAGINNDFFFCSIPLPISRVNSVYFETEDLKDKISTLINLSTAFVPKNLLRTFQNAQITEAEGIIPPMAATANDYSEKLMKYNSLLGGFALMKLAREPYMNFSDNYFSTLSFFNSLIEEDLLKSKKISPIFQDVFIGKDSFKTLKPFLDKTISEDDLLNIAVAENQMIKKDVITGLIDFNSLDRATYIVAVLYSFGIGDEGRKSKVDGLILSNFQKNIKADKSEVIALCYGLNRGYSAFSNKYKNESSEQVVKFELTSKLDYYTIESIYQYVINSVKSSSFPYLDSVIPRTEFKNKKHSKNDYYIFDKLVITERIKVGDSKWWSKFLNFFFQKSQEELFKPFLISALQKIKEDLEDEFYSEIENKDFELQLLKNKNLELIQKINDSQKRDAGKEKALYTNVMRDESILQENAVNYEAADNLNNSQLFDLKQKIRDYERLLKLIDKETVMKEAKKRISDFHKKSTNDELFKK